MRGRDREREGGKGAKLKNKQKKETLNAFGEELGAIENQKKKNDRKTGKHRHRTWRGGER